MLRTGKKWNTQKCGKCGNKHYNYSGMVDSKGNEYVTCGKTNKRMNIKPTFLDYLFNTKWYEVAADCLSCKHSPGFAGWEKNIRLDSKGHLQIISLSGPCKIDGHNIYYPYYKMCDAWVANDNYNNMRNNVSIRPPTTEYVKRYFGI